MAGAVVTGVVGQVRWHHYVAAAINGYTVTRTNQQWSMRGTVVLADAFKLSQRPLLFVAPYKVGTVEREWCWPILTHEITNGSLTATLGPPQE